MDSRFYFTGSLQLVSNNGTLCFLQESLYFVSFSSYFLSLDTGQRACQYLGPVLGPR
jgi:hypothetical protein